MSENTAQNMQETDVNNYINHMIDAGSAAEIAYETARMTGMESENWDGIVTVLSENCNAPEADLAAKLQPEFLKMASELTTRAAGIAGAGKGWAQNRALSHMFVGAVQVCWGEPLASEFSASEQEIAQQVVDGGVYAPGSKKEIEDLRNADLIDRVAAIPAVGNGLDTYLTPGDTLLVGDRENAAYRTMTRVEHMILLAKWSWAAARGLAHAVSNGCLRNGAQAGGITNSHFDSQSHAHVTSFGDFGVLEVFFDATLNRKSKDQARKVLDAMPQLKRQSEVSPALSGTYPFAFVGAYVGARAGFAAPRAVNFNALPMPASVCAFLLEVSL